MKKAKISNMINQQRANKEDNDFVFNLNLYALKLMKIKFLNKTFINIIK